MPLHERESVREHIEDCVFAGRDLTRQVPKYRFPRDESAPKEAFQVVADELMLDGNSRQNLATFCQTWAEPEVLALMALSVDKNMIDKDEYPQTAEIEARCVHMLADLWHAPDSANTVGDYAMDPESMLARVDENTIMVVPTLGVTYTGAYEPVEAMSSALDQLQANTGLDIGIHVDGASGAFLAPFCAPDLMFDFRLPRVKSISTSGHKFGLAPLGVGWVVWRDREELPEDLVFHVNYLGGDMPVFQINFSRPAGQIIAQYYNFLRLGFEGYKGIHEASYAIGQYLAAEIAKVGPFELLCDSNPATGIPTVTWRIRDGADPGYTLFDLADRLRTRGWQVPAYTLTGTASDIAVQRILVRLGVSHDMASLLLDDFRGAVAHFAKHPVTVPMSKEETSGFNHL